MAGKKDQSLVVIIDGLTKTQAANMQADIIKSKGKHAPNARAIATQGSRQDVSKMISAGHDDIKKIADKDESADGKKK